MTTDLISTAFVSFLTLAEKSGASEIAKRTANEAYDCLKSILLKKFGHESEPVQALARLEANPASEGRRVTLTEELTKLRAAADLELSSAAQSLLTIIQAFPRGEQHTQSIVGDQNAVASHGGMAQVNVYATAGAKKGEA